MTSFSRRAGWVIIIGTCAGSKRGVRVEVPAMIGRERRVAEEAGKRDETSREERKRRGREEKRGFLVVARVAMMMSDAVDYRTTILELSLPVLVFIFLD